MTSRRALNVVVTVPAAESELASDALWRLGAMAVEERPAGGAFSPDETAVELRAALGDDRRELRRVLRVLRWPWRLEQVDLAVADTWREFAQPTVVDERVIVYPAWVEPGDGPQDIRIAIEPGPTFGLGNHPTTVLVLQALRRVLRPGDRVLDVGTGSGVLAIAAVMLGAGAAHGVDITPACLDVVAENAARNDVADRVTVSTEPLATLDGPYDVVLANILAPTLVELAPELRRLTGRVIVVSGLLAEGAAHGRTEAVRVALAPLGLRETLTLDGWAALILER